MEQNSLTDKKTLEEIIKLYNLCFDANSLADRIAYYISVTRNYTKFGDWFHHNISHFFTGENLADGIEAFGELRNDLFYRDALPRHDENYNSISEAMKKITMAVTDIQNQCVQALHSAADNGSESYEDFLRTLNVEQISPLLKQCILLYDMADEYEFASDSRKINIDYEGWVLDKFKDISSGGSDDD